MGPSSTPSTGSSTESERPPTSGEMLSAAPASHTSAPMNSKRRRTSSRTPSSKTPFRREHVHLKEALLAKAGSFVLQHHFYITDLLISCVFTSYPKEILHVLKPLHEAHGKLLLADINREAPYSDITFFCICK